MKTFHQVVLQQSDYRGGTQSHYTGRLYERLWMTTFQQNSFVPGPTEKSENDWKLVLISAGAIAVEWFGGQQVGPGKSGKKSLQTIRRSPQPLNS
jgi:hypothetical protein